MVAMTARHFHRYAVCRAVRYAGLFGLLGITMLLASCGGGGGGAPSFSLNVNLNGNETVISNPAGINCTTGNQGTCQKSFSQGTQLTLTAAPESGWQFSNWAGCDSVNGNQCTLMTNASKTRTANLVQITWAKTYGGGSDDIASSIQQTSDGGYIVAGFTDSFGAGYSDFWVLKLNASGDVANCSPSNLVRNSNGTSVSTSVTPSGSSATPATPSPMITNTSVVGQYSGATSATQCTG
jgi:hypothetical protein